MADVAETVQETFKRYKLYDPNEKVPEGNSQLIPIDQTHFKLEIS